MEKDKNEEVAKTPKKEVTTKENLTDWLVYFVCVAIFIFPFFQDSIAKHISASLIISFLFGMLNRIIRELTLIKDKLDEEK